MANSLIIAAPHSASGKTIVTLALLRALKNRGVSMASAKAGPDYIDPRFHQAATQKPCYNLDGWAMRTQTMDTIMDRLAGACELAVIEGVMGLFDGPEQGKGSTADLAAHFALPVVLVVDASHQAQSVAALATGFARFRDDVHIAGVILNKVASPRHTATLTHALDDAGIAVFGALPRHDAFALPARHLGLVQAGEHKDLDGLLERAASVLAEHVDLAALQKAARPLPAARPANQQTAGRPPAQSIAIASDAAFGFTYPHMVESWARQGANINWFSPLAGEAPDAGAGFIFLPGGYPELHCAKLSARKTFFDGLAKAASRGAIIYGECGGYMVLGKALIDAQGTVHQMAGLLPHTTSFAARRLNLGYRTLHHKSPLPFPAALRGHEFHYSTLLDGTGRPPALFEAAGSTGRTLGPMGSVISSVMGSYAHIIDADSAA